MSSTTSHVHTVDSTTFQPLIETNPVVVVSFLAPLSFSSRCKKFVPEFEEIASAVQSHGIEFAQMHALENPETYGPFMITSFPTLLLFQGMQDITRYRGALRKNSIIAYLERFLNYPVLSPVSLDTVGEFMNGDDAVVVGYVTPEQVVETRMFRQVAETLHPEYVFGVCDDPTVADAEGVCAPGIGVYVNDEQISVVKFDEDLPTTINLLRLAARPMITDLLTETHEGLWDLGIPMGYIFVTDPQQETRLRKTLPALAAQNRQRLLLTLGNPESLEDYVEDLHVPISPEGSGFAIREPKRNLRYPMPPTSLSFDNAITSFIDQYFSNHLHPTIKSEPIPPPSSSALVKVVGQTYHSIVEANDKDVLLTYCIDPCGPCVALYPILVALADLYAADPLLKEKVTVGIIDYERNDVTERRIQGFPTVKLFSAGDKTRPVLFLGERSLEALERFVKENGIHRADLRQGEDGVSRQISNATSSKNYCTQTAGC